MKLSDPSPTQTLRLSETLSSMPNKTSNATRVIKLEHSKKLVGHITLADAPRFVLNLSGAPTLSLSKST